MQTALVSVVYYFNGLLPEQHFNVVVVHVSVTVFSFVLQNDYISYV